MAKVFIEETTLTAIGDAIRGKTGKTELIDPANMSTEIAGIEAGGGGYEVPDEALNITGSAAYRFANGGWDWFLRDFGNKITTSNLAVYSNMFSSSRVEEIPFQLNIKEVAYSYEGHNFTNMFNSCKNLKICPKIRGTINSVAWNTGTNFSDMMTNCHSLTNIDDLFTPEMIEDFSTYKVTSSYSAINPFIPEYMFSLRSLPSWWYNFKLNPESTAFPNSTYAIYYTLGQRCYVLDELANIPVWTCQAGATSNLFNYAFDNCARAKTITFETNADGSPIEAKWKSQTINLTNCIGKASTTTDITNSSSTSGVISAKLVSDDATYQALKDDPDWWTINWDYCRYNHDSAVETINSLPDTSAYLASAGGTNTIKFKKTAGSRTDGGAIGNLTEEEIAVAAAKGWTVTFA